MKMTSQAAANPFANPALPTLADVIDAVHANPQLSSTQKTARASAVRTVGRAIALPLSAITAHPAFLRKKMAAVTPARVGLTPGSWANAKSLLAKTLKEQGVDVAPGRYLAPIAEDWLPLWNSLPERPFKIALSRFIRFCSTRGVAPEEVTEDHFDAFEVALRKESFIKKPEKAVWGTRRHWNEAGKLTPGWPGLRVEVTDRRARYQVPLSSFPKSFSDDLNDYRAALTADVLDLDSAIKPIRPISAESKIEALHRLASAAVAGGLGVEDIPDLRALIRPDVVRRALRFIRERNGRDKLKSFDLLLAHAISTARHWVKAPEEDIKALCAIKRALNVNTYEMSEKTRRVLRDLDQPGVLQALINLPKQVFDEILRKAELKRSDLIRIQTALAISILIAAPMRPSNLVSLHLERHLIEVGVGRHRRLHIRIPGEEVKNGEPLEYPLPDRVMVLLKTYLDEIRPQISAPGNLHLFPGRGGGPKGVDLLSEQIADLTQARLGVRMTAHKFRAAAGKTILDADPTGQEIARQVLGHRDIHTTTAFYAPLQRDRAISLYDAAISAAEGVDGDRP